MDKVDNNQDSVIINQNNQDRNTEVPTRPQVNKRKSIISRRSNSTKSNRTAPASNNTTNTTKKNRTEIIREHYKKKWHNYWNKMNKSIHKSLGNLNKSIGGFLPPINFKTGFLGYDDSSFPANHIWDIIKHRFNLDIDNFNNFKEDYHKYIPAHTYLKEADEDNKGDKAETKPKKDYYNFSQYFNASDIDEQVNQYFNASNYFNVSEYTNKVRDWASGFKQVNPENEQILRQSKILK